MAERDLNININIDIRDLTEENEKRIVSLVEKLYKKTKVTTNVKTPQKPAKPKILNSEKEIQKKKNEILFKIKEKPDTVYAKIINSIFRRIRFTLQELREEFPNENFGTIRSYVNGLKLEGLLIEMDRGKYVLK